MPCHSLGMMIICFSITMNQIEQSNTNSLTKLYIITVNSIAIVPRPITSIYFSLEVGEACFESNRTNRLGAPLKDTSATEKFKKRYHTT
jgi:hypothetical protein